MKNFFKSIKFRLSDLFLALGFLPFAVILIFGQLFMQFQNPSDVAFPLWAAILCFVVMVISWSFYLYLEVYRSKEKYNLWIACACATLILLNIPLIKSSFISNFNFNSSSLSSSSIITKNNFL